MAFLLQQTSPQEVPFFWGVGVRVGLTCLVSLPTATVWDYFPCFESSFTFLEKVRNDSTSNASEPTLQQTGGFALKTAPDVLQQHTPQSSLLCPLVPCNRGTLSALLLPHWCDTTFACPDVLEHNLYTKSAAFFSQFKLLPRIITLTFMFMENKKKKK